MSYKTVSINKENADKKWLLVDAEGQTLGRLASEVAKRLRGKHKPNFTPHADCGDYVIVVNAEKVVLTGNKWDQKEYIRYTGYPGGQRTRTAKEPIAAIGATLAQRTAPVHRRVEQTAREARHPHRCGAGTTVL